MKLDGSLLSPLKFSSLKYDRTWVVCFQKFIISCKPRPLVSAHHIGPMASPLARSYLVLGVRLEEEDVCDRELVDVSVSLELLAYPGADGGDGHGQVVHSLDLRSL